MFMEKVMSSSSSEILRAGAGSGKTTALVNKVFLKSLSLIKENHPKSLIVCTFTRKATQELKERLLEKACSENNENLIEYFSSTSFVVSTIHGVLSLFLRQYGFHLGLDPSFELISPSEKDRISRQILRDTLLLSDTSILKYESFESLLENCKKYSEKKLSYKERISFFAKDEILKIHKKCYKDLAFEFFKEEGYDGVSQFFKELSENPYLYNAENFKTLYGKTKPKTNLLKKIKIQIEDSSFLDCKRSLNAVKFYEQFEKIASQFTDTLFSKKLSQSLLTYSDLETFSFQLLNKHPHLGYSFSKNYDSWFVDEYQDTSPLQVKLFEALKEKAFDFCVGDPNQSIYLFRGARYKVFEQKEKTSKQLEPLLKNYRSNGSLVSFFNDFFKDFNPIQIGREGTLKDEPVVVLGDFKKEEDELKAILHHVLSVKKKTGRRESICILCRTEDTAYKITRFFKKHKIYVVMNNSSSFSKKREVIDSLSLLGFLANPHDAENLLILLRSPWCRLPDSFLVSVLKDKPYSFWNAFQKKDHPVINALKVYLKKSEKEGLSYVFEKALVELGFFDFSSYIDPSGQGESHLWRLVYELRKAEKTKGFNINLFIESMEWELSEKVWDQNSDYVQVMTIHSSKGLQFDHVVIPFLDKKKNHKKDNFVFDDHLKKWVVKFFDPDKGKSISLLPYKQVSEKMKTAEDEEERRLFYVAMTRAKESLFLCYGGSIRKDSIGVEIYNYFKDKGFLNESKVYDLKNYKLEVIFSLPENISLEKESHFVKKSDKLEIKTIGSYESVLEPPQKKFRGVSVFDLAQTAQRGIRVHRLMEALKVSESFDVRRASWISSNQRESFQKAKNYILNLKQPPLRSLLKTGYVEWGFQVKIKDYVIKGRIDFWSETEDEIWIVDYKSGTESLKNKVFLQLETYSLYFRKNSQFRNKAIKLAAIYPFSESIYVKEAPSEKDLLFRSDFMT